MHLKILPRGARGFTLVEVLVSIVVLSIGALGVANLQLLGIYANGAGNQRSIAATLANDLIDRVRANRAAAIDGNYDIAAADATPDDPGCLGATADCTPPVTAQADLNWWRRALGGLLNSATGAVAVNDPTSAEPSLTVTITWQSPGAGGASQYALTVQL